MIAARNFQSPVGVSARHVHLTSEHIAILFGHELHIAKALGQTGEFASVESITLATFHCFLHSVRVLGPARSQTQVELSRTDSINLGLDVPIRLSGNLEGSPGITLIGPHGTVQLLQGVIIAARHLHISQKDASRLGLKSGDLVSARSSGNRSCLFEDVIVRVTPTGVLELHLDTDEANAAALTSGEIIDIIIPERPSSENNDRRYICLEDVELLIRAGDRLRLKPGQKITSSALELARSKNVLIQ